MLGPIFGPSSAAAPELVGSKDRISVQGPRTPDGTERLDITNQTKGAHFVNAPPCGLQMNNGMKKAHDKGVYRSWPGAMALPAPRVRTAILDQRKGSLMRSLALRVFLLVFGVNLMFVLSSCQTRTSEGMLGDRPWTKNLSEDHPFLHAHDESERPATIVATHGRGCLLDVVLLQ